MASVSTKFGIMRTAARRDGLTFAATFAARSSDSTVMAAERP
ncbi:unannotated protein [freshwater metagenome]|uniref:Unannotated protein n=1 Tax=freshwater metagenome TaxID=449393 RepID=A0A6J6RHA9_9ZZZZ